MKSKIFSLSLAIFFVAANSPFYCVEKLRDFRGTNQNLALIGMTSEFVDPATEGRITNDLRRRMNRYTKSYGESTVGSFKMGPNPGKQFFRPVPDTPSEQQKKFLQDVCKDNAVDILVLGTVRQVGEETEVELQLFDVRDDTFSKVEKSKISSSNDSAALDNLVFRVMNYLDRDGYVFNTPQDFLQPPINSLSTTIKMPTPSGTDDFAINPNDLSGGTLAGDVSIGGDHNPFWEKWWFWAIIGGGLLTAGSLTYYFVVVNQPPNAANINFQMP